jgi:hypothetical protein
MRRQLTAFALLLFATHASTKIAAQQARDARDLQGLWTNGTLTPLQRPPDFADKPTLSEEEAAAFEKGGIERLLKQLPHDDVVTAGDLNDTYLETATLKLVEGRRTALIVDPPNGRLPAFVPEAQKRLAARPKRSFDNPETLTLDERCIFSTAMGSSNAAPPMVPNTFGLNFYQIVQTKDHVMILSEMVHDARVIRIGGHHLPSNVRLWLGDSIGRWEGDTLVVDTTNELLAEVGLPRRHRTPPRRRTLHASGGEHDPLRGDRRRSRDVGYSVDRRHPVQRHQPADLRILLPRGQLLSRLWTARRAPRRQVVRVPDRICRSYRVVDGVQSSYVS